MQSSNQNFPGIDLTNRIDDHILITGSNGFIGSQVVKVLLKSGCRNIRCFVRPSSRLDALNEIIRLYGAGIQPQIIEGDLSSPIDCSRATSGISIIYHLAASFEKSFDNVLKNSVQGTENLLTAFASHGKAKRFVLVSSFAVYSNLHLKRGALLDEKTQLEDSPRKRADAYAFGKLRQEELVHKFCLEQKITFAVLRPGTVFGPGKKNLTGRIGISIGGIFIHVGGANQLPLTYVDNCAEAIVLAGFHPNAKGETFNVVDDELLTSREFLYACRKHIGLRLTIPFPYFIAYLLCAICEFCARWIKRLPLKYNRRYCAAEWKGNRFSNSKLREQLGWTPRIPMKEAMNSFLAQFGS